MIACHSAACAVSEGRHSQTPSDFALAVLTDVWRQRARERICRQTKRVMKPRPQSVILNRLSQTPGEDDSLASEVDMPGQVVSQRVLLLQQHNRLLATTPGFGKCPLFASGHRSGIGDTLSHLVL